MGNGGGAPKPGFDGSHYAALRLPLALIAVFAALALLPQVRQHPVLGPSFWGWAAFLLAWLALLSFSVIQGHRKLSIEYVPRKQHYLQATVQAVVFVYWGWYWRQVYDEAGLILAQLVFAYAFDMLLGFTRRDRYVFGFGPFPIIFSTNLFLWFKDDWFYLQFLMIAVGFLGKEFVRWHRDGRHTHIFNPSAFSLGIFSLVILVTGTTDLTWGPLIATTLNLAPHIYLLLFLLGLVVMYFFATTLVTATTAVTIFGLSALYSFMTGVPFFIDSEIPIAVFLGLHLLVTDPSTSPRTPSGKVIFGLLYGLGVFGLYELLGRVGAPTFYDKLLCVPLLNLSVQAIDRLVKSGGHGLWLKRLGLQTVTPSTNLAHMAVWIVFFVTMAAIGSTDGRHTGDSVPFWQQACADDRRLACDRLFLIESVYCSDGSGWACNEVGIHHFEGRFSKADPALSEAYVSRSCELGFRSGCINLLAPGSMAREVPRIIDLRLMLREGKHNLLEMPEQELYTRACEHGWEFACPKNSSP